MKKLKPSRQTKGVLRVGSGDLLGVAACICALSFGTILVIFFLGVYFPAVNEIGDARLGGSLENKTNALANAKHDHGKSSDSKENTWGGVFKCATNGFCLNAQVCVSIYTNHVEMIPEENGSNASYQDGELKSVSPCDGSIQIYIIFHVMRVATPNEKS